ncbi:MAG: hypothetical protein GX577_06670 [Leptolinea sp.]|nr:hypothetical protein [Leptolinea sp.]
MPDHFESILLRYSVGFNIRLFAQAGEWRAALEIKPQNSQITYAYKS